MALSAMTLDLCTYLQNEDFIGKQVLTLDSLAEHFDTTKAKINGSLMTFRNKGLITNVKAIDADSQTVVSYIVPSAEIMDFDPSAASSTAKSGSTMKEGSIKLLRRLQQMHEAGNNEDVTARDLAEALGVSVASVNGTLTSFQRKGWVERSEAVGRINPETNKAENVKFIRTLPAIMEATAE
jgi:DNA-binding MarR family transcriptional regulator